MEENNIDVICSIFYSIIINLYPFFIIIEFY